MQVQKIVKSENRQIVDSLMQGRIFDDHPWFYHKDYIIVPQVVRSKQDIIGQHILTMTFKIESRSGKWDTAETLQYVARIVFVLKSLVECARVAVNYDTAMNSLTVKRHATITVDYVVNRVLAEKAMAELENKENTMVQKVLTGEVIIEGR